MRTQVFPLFVGVIVIVFILFMLTQKPNTEHFKLPSGSYRSSCNCEQKMSSDGRSTTCGQCGYFYNPISKQHALTCQCKPDNNYTTVNWKSNTCPDIKNINGKLQCGKK